jgi:hypothetical protein
MIPQNRFEPRSAPQRGGGINMIQNALMGQGGAPQANMGAFQDQQAKAMMGLNRPPQGGMMGGPGPAPIRQPSQMQNMMGAVQAVGGMGPQQAPQYTPQQVQGMRANAQPMQNFAQRAGQMMNRTMPAPAPAPIRQVTPMSQAPRGF